MTLGVVDDVGVMDGVMEGVLLLVAVMVAVMLAVGVMLCVDKPQLKAEATTEAVPVVLDKLDEPVPVWLLEGVLVLLLELVRVWLDEPESVDDCAWVGMDASEAIADALSASLYTRTSCRLPRKG